MMTSPPKAKRGPGLVGQSMAPSAEKTRASAVGGSKKGHFYKPLSAQFRRHGFTYRQIAREGDVAIYKQTWLGCAEPSPCYEVIRICRREGFQIGGRFIEPAEVYPASKLWGVDGFTFTNREKAWTKLLKCRWKNQQEQERR
jgi:hypothetical protein